MAPMEGENAILLQLRETAGLTAELAVSSPRAKIHGIKECDVTGIPLKKKVYTLRAPGNKIHKNQLVIQLS